LLKGVCYVWPTDIKKHGWMDWYTVFTVYFIIIIKTKKFLIALKLRCLIKINMIAIITLPSNKNTYLPLIFVITH